MDGYCYRYHHKRALTPEILTTPRVHALLHSVEGGARLRPALQQCFNLAHNPGSKLHGGYSGLGDFQVETVWSPTPQEPDLFVILGPGDAIPFWRLLLEFRAHRDRCRLADLIRVAFV